MNTSSFNKFYLPRPLAILLPILLLTYHTNLLAQADSGVLKNRYTLSLLTCGAGEEVYTTFGHNAIRIKDAATHTDLVYNYGTFNGFDPDFEIQFMRGKLPYYLSTDPFESFMRQYSGDGRFVKEQILNLTEEQERKVVQLLENNLKEENKYYKYDFLWDNCATRVRDIISQGYGSGFAYGAHPDADNKTFRAIINEYLYAQHWTRLGINILLGCRVDAKATNEQLMFIPDYLTYCLAHATYNSVKVTDTHNLIRGLPAKPADTNRPAWVMLSVLLLMIIVSRFKSLRILKSVLMFLLLFVSGLLGCLMLFMWLGTDHQACAWNWNILWALPSNLVVAFMPKRNKKGYALFALAAMAVMMVLHLLKLQWFSLLELSPLLASLLITYLTLANPSKYEPSDK